MGQNFSWIEQVGHEFEQQRAGNLSLRHGSLPREDDGALEFWRIKDNLQKHFLYCHHWSDDKWKKNMARGGGNKNRY